MIQEEPYDQSSSQGRSVNPFWPVLLVALSLIIMLSYQFILVFGQRLALQKQIQQQSEVVTRANQTQNELQRLVVDLLALAETGDADAKAIVAKYKIANTAPAQAPR